MGFEPMTYGLRNHCSTTELFRQHGVGLTTELHYHLKLFNAEGRNRTADAGPRKVQFIGLTR